MSRGTFVDGVTMRDRTYTAYARSPHAHTRIRGFATGHPPGIKAAGESGAIGAPVAVANAVVDALWYLGLRNIAMPITRRAKSMR